MRATETELEPSPPPEGELPRARKKLAYAVLLTAVLLVIGATVAVVIRLNERRALAREAEMLAVPNVTVTRPSSEPPQQELVLPSTLESYTESPIYARTSGYLNRWYKDIGSHVKKGGLLADIETPEVDQELMQARAARNQAEAQLNLAKTSAERWSNLRAMDAVAQQESDERSSGYTQAQAALASATANVRRLEQLESFKHIYAPITGVITKRNTDVGALINAGNSGANQELFVVAQINPLRVYVDVPELYAASIQPGIEATVELAALPGALFRGKVVRTSDAIDPGTRTLRTEIDLPNPEGRLFPGSYAQVRFHVVVSAARFSVPVNAVLFRAEGPHVALVGSDKRVHLKPVTIGRDYGMEVEILNGLNGTDLIVLNPSDSLEEGQTVRVAKSGERP